MRLGLPNFLRAPSANVARCLGPYLPLCLEFCLSANSFYNLPIAGSTAVSRRDVGDDPMGRDADHCLKGVAVFVGAPGSLLVLSVARLFC